MRHIGFIVSALSAFACLSTTACANVRVHGAQGGVNKVTGERPFRQNIETLQNSGPAWDLYIQALATLQARDQSQWDSWFQIAGIHGLPFIPWDGAQGKYRAGYAMHSSILFGPWHRAYLVLYEQIVNELAQDVAQKYPSDVRKQYQDAALSLRIPYWDWAAAAKLPKVVTQPQIAVDGPEGRKTIANPLYSYGFHPVPGGNLFPSKLDLSHSPGTIRQPNKKGMSQYDLINKMLTASFKNTRDRLYILFATQKNYAPFSNTAYHGPLRGNNYDSLEGIHNQIHGIVGGEGQMGYIPFSAFDPIFFLHHTNVDRLDAIWCAIYPNSWVIPQADGPGTFTEAPHTVENGGTRLTPFRQRNGSGKFITAAAMRYLKQFGYSYPEVVDWGVTPAQLSENARVAVKKLYGGGTNSKRSLDPEGVPISSEEQRNWNVNLRVNKNALNGPFTIFFFFGNAPDDESEWATASNLVSLYYVLGTHEVSSKQPLLGQVPLTNALQQLRDEGGIDSLEPGQVRRFLKKSLRWQVQKPDGTVIDPKDVQGLHISVVDQVVRLSDREDKLVANFTEPADHPDLQWDVDSTNHTRFDQPLDPTPDPSPPQSSDAAPTLM